MTMTSRACGTLAAGIFLFAACGGTNEPADEVGSSGGVGGSLSLDSSTSGTGGSSSSAGVSGTGGVSGSGGVPSAPAPPPCNDLALDAPAFLLHSDPGAAPTATGGTIVDGTYFVTAATMYGQSLSDLPFGRHEVQIAGSTWQEVESVDSEPDGVNPDEHRTFSLTSTGTSLTLSRSCPAGSETEVLQYSAEGSRLTVYVRDHGVVFANIFTRQ